MSVILQFKYTKEEAIDAWKKCVAGLFGKKDYSELSVEELQSIKNMYTSRQTELYISPEVLEDIKMWNKDNES